MSMFASFQKSKIARRLVVYILIFSSGVTLGLTAVQLYQEYRYDVSRIDMRFDQILGGNPFLNRLGGDRYRFFTQQLASGHGFGRDI